MSCHRQNAAVLYALPSAGAGSLYAVPRAIKKDRHKPLRLLSVLFIQFCVRSRHYGIGIIKAQPKRLRFYGHSAGVPFSCISRIAPVKPAACGRGRILPPRMTLLIICRFASTAESIFLRLLNLRNGLRFAVNSELICGFHTEYLRIQNIGHMII